MTENIAAIPPKPLPVAQSTAVTAGIETETIAVGSAPGGSGPDGSPTFADLLDIINPLQHIPIVSSIYRAITGDEIGAAPRAFGGFLYGGPLGALAAGLTGLFEEASGGNIVTHVASLVDEIGGGGDTSVAAAGTAPAPEILAGAGTDIGANIGATASADGFAGGRPDAPPDAPPDAMAANTAAILQRLGGEIQARDLTAQAVQAHSLRNVPGTSVAAARLADFQQAAGLSTAVLRPGASGAALNRIAFDPAAPVGMAQGVPAPGRAAGQPVFPARPMAMPFAAQRPAAPMPAHPGPPATIAARSSGAPQPQQQNADALLARWAAQQMALQNRPAPPGDDGTDGKDATGPQSVAEAPAARIAPPSPIPSAAPAALAAPAGGMPHPMLPPQNASPEWYAQAMGAALNRYQAGGNTALPPTSPANAAPR